MPTPILVTGAAGFIGHAVSHRLIERGETVIGVDNLNNYYDPAVKGCGCRPLTAGANSCSNVWTSPMPKVSPR